MLYLYDVTGLVLLTPPDADDVTALEYWDPINRKKKKKNGVSFCLKF